MKLSLVVSEGVHQGKVINIPVAQFLIGRDEVCQLRPSSPAVSKKHCAILVKSGKVFVKDFGSTNGTFVNENQVEGEVEVKDGDSIKAGPLAFTLKLEQTATHTPIPPSKPAEASKPTPPPADRPTVAEETDPEQLAALLLGTDDGPPGPITESSIPEGSTVFEMPAGAGADKKVDKNKAANEGDNSKRAADILRKYMQRPRAQ